MKKSKSKSTKGKIIKDYTEFVEYDWKDDSILQDIPNSLSKPKGRGIYALYDNHGLYYVGLTTDSLRYRIKRHTRDRHRKKWNKFSWYLIPNFKYSKDMETAILRIINPKGNRVKGRIRRKPQTKKATK
jgi:predicted GIY-YIG superfamily endonuclease